ncbi:MAG: LysR family transcriptional regulator [Clostridiales bacterium]|nr:LysR family transcriptional regulator [Clostridiales bacterium]
MDINYLREFRVLAEICNYQEAAEQLYISLSTLSKHITRLETELGSALFDRTTRKVKLNKYGAAFYDYAVLITDSYLACTHKLEDLREDESVTLRIAFPPCLTEYNLPALLTDFMNTHPEVKIIIMEDGHPRKLFRDDLCDLAFCTEYGTIAEPDHALHMELDSLVAILPENHPLAAEKHLSMEQLREERFITKSDSSDELSIIFRKLCDEAGFKPDTICTICYTSAMPKMVNACHGIAITNRRHAQISGVPNLAVVDIHPTVPYHAYLLCRKQQKLTAASQCFLDFITKNTPLHTNKKYRLQPE